MKTTKLLLLCVVTVLYVAAEKASGHGPEQTVQTDLTRQTRIPRGILGKIGNIASTGLCVGIAVGNALATVAANRFRNAHFNDCLGRSIPAGSNARTRCTFRTLRDCVKFYPSDKPKSLKCYRDNARPRPTAEFMSIATKVVACY